MNKNLMIGLAFVLGIGGILFFDEVLAIFAGMSALQAMETIWAFVLRAAVATVIGYVALGALDIVKPWVRMLKRSGRARSRAMRRGEMQVKVTSPRSPRMNKDAVIAWLASQKLQKVKTQQVENPVKFEL